MLGGLASLLRRAAAPPPSAPPATTPAVAASPLSRGAVRAMVVDGVEGLSPVLQVIHVTRFPSVPNASGVQGCWRVWLSDGEHFCQALFDGVYLEPFVESGAVCLNRVVRVDECVERVSEGCAGSLRTC